MSQCFVEPLQAISPPATRSPSPRELSPPATPSIPIPIQAEPSQDALQTPKEIMAMYSGGRCSRSQAPVAPASPGAVVAVEDSDHEMVVISPDKREQQKTRAEAEHWELSKNF